MFKQHFFIIIHVECSGGSYLGCATE